MSSISQYKRTEVIGRGKFGVVYKAYHKQTKQVYAIKVLNLDTEEEEILDVQQEIQFLTELKNVPNITHYYGSILNDTKLWIVMDYCAGGSLRTLLKPGVMEEKYIAIIVRELLLTLSAVHKLGVIHRDLKAANVLISKEGNVQLCDFGVAAKISANATKRTTMAGTPYWMAPEVIKTGETYNSKADIWSLGITIYEIATGNPPYCDKDASWAMQLISKATPPRLEGSQYSPALKECIALCLDENPEERPSADDLFRCKLMKIYKTYPTHILKEVISRYLLWRDRNSSRDSVFINLENEREDTVDEIVQNKLPSYNDYGVEINNNNDDQLQVKWDFDSLESREYMMENDIDINNIEYSKNYETQNGENTYSTIPTLKATTFSGGSGATLNTQTKSIADIPKSLQMLFEDPAEESKNEHPILAPPSMMNDINGTESPTIEIPDMDALSNFPSTSTLINHGHPVLNKPPTLYHTQSASGNLETRYTSVNTSPIENRPRKKTISNTLGQNTPVNTTTTIPTPHTPPYVSNASARSPSPKPPTSLGVPGISSKTSSPSKMKALQGQGNNNPLLQPINFKAGNDLHSKITSAANPQPPIQAPPQLVQQQSMPILPVNPPSNIKNRRNKPAFIQMPTPSATVNSLSALTNDHHEEDENVNQFGINPAQAAYMHVSMTPVTEKEPPQFPTNSTASSTSTKVEEQQYEKPIKESSPNPQSRPHQNSISAQKKTQQAPSNLSINTNINHVHSNSIPHNLSSSNLSNQHPNLNKSNTTINHSSQASQQQNGLNTTIQPSINFPIIPTIKNDFFIDSTTNKSKLVNELDTIIKLFNHGLDALEENL
ncbi:KIC1 [Candida jiufengensis]|uniref:KIC1 n=1 Tax=Candida jiufengensis TaxID=497108 RepID=UPI0022248AFA|nr:KIC1 [Candida jiufengensis]KAI5951881.1 KIC1 [Candida jiufengensis]